MSAQATAKLAQGYQAKPVPSTCGNCHHVAIPIALSRFDQNRNAIQVAAGRKPFRTVELHGQEQTPRCAIGKFATAKSATCAKFAPKVAP